MTDLMMRSLGLSLLFLGLAIGSLSRTMNIADSTKNLLSVVSILFSISAVVLFIKATPAPRRPMVVIFMVVAIAAVALITFLFLPRH